MATENDNATSQTIVVASLNPVKIGAVKQGFSSLFATAASTVTGLKVPSEVPDQPLTDKETLQGALNRVKNARAASPDADFWIGVEGGIDTEEDSMQSFAWVVVMGKDGRVGKARTATYYLPRETIELMKQGMELGAANDVLYGQSNSKQKTGSVGLLTNDAIDRQGYYMQAVVLALIPFNNTHLTF